MNVFTLEALVQASLSAAVMILAVLILRLRFRTQTPQRVYCLLWDIVLLRLLVPVQISSPFSVRRLLELRPLQAQATVCFKDAVMENAAAYSGVAEDTAVRYFFAPTVVQAGTAHTVNFLALLWGAGVVLCALRLLWGHLQSRSIYAMSLPVEDDFIRRWQDQHPLRRFVQVRHSDRIPAPLTYGVLQPVVLLPGRMDLTDRENLSYVLEHEYTHIRRFDTLRKYLLAAGLCLHWFNPAVWLMYILANRDIELACDEAVVRAGADRRGYALALLRMEEERGGQSLSGSHFSGHALEERIEAIMKHKKTSLAALLAVLLVMSVTTTVFAAGAPEDGKKGGAVTLGLVDGRGTQTITQDVLTISGGPDGEKFFSLDGGETWMTEERYHAQYGEWGDGWNIEWWTYDEYKAWLEQEKANLADIIGSRGYTGDKGWFVWDQAMVDETIALYEETLEHIKNGGLYSKNIIDTDNGVVENAVLSSGTADAVAMDFDESYTIVDYTREAHRRSTEIAELLKSYEPFGVTGNEKDGLYYNGQPVHYLVDGYAIGDSGYGIQYVYINGEGTVDVHTLRETVPLSGGGVDPSGPLTGIVKKGDTSYDAGLFECLLVPAGGHQTALSDGQPVSDSVQQQTGTVEAQGNGSSSRGRTFEEIFAAYAQWGLVYDASAQNEFILTYNGQPAARFADLKPDGSVFSYENPYAENGLNVYTEYDETGRLTGLTVQ